MSKEDIFVKVGKAVAKALPVLPLILIIDWVLLTIAKGMGLVIDNTLKGMLLNIFVSLVEIILVLLYADLLLLLGFRKRR